MLYPNTFLRQRGALTQFFQPRSPQNTSWHTMASFAAAAYSTSVKHQCCCTTVNFLIALVLFFHFLTFFFYASRGTNINLCLLWCSKQGDKFAAIKSMENVYCLSNTMHVHLQSLSPVRITVFFVWSIHPVTDWENNLR